jgi:hypothetical protein
MPPVASPPVKRSGHVALLVMGTMAVGGGAFALMPRQNCQPTSPGIASPEAAAACASSSGGSHGGSSGWWSHSNFYNSSSGTSTSSGSSETTRGGFGGFARAISAHFSGGG